MISKRRKWVAITMFMALSTSVIGTGSALAEQPAITATAGSEAAINAAVSDMPAGFKSSIEWVYNNRMVKEGSVSRKNLIYDQIFAGKGTINYVVRWQSSKNLTLQQRKDIEKMLGRQLNNWTKNLKGYDGWPYGDISVKVVGWAVANSSQILDRQPGEIVYTQTIVDDLSKTDPRIPAALPVAPNELSRFEHFSNPNYAYPGGLDKRFDMYLWGTTNFGGGAGGDWGQRVSDDYILSTVNNNEVHITEHEIGHGFGMPDFYEDKDRPPGGFPQPTIMWAGNSATITNWDVWLLRYTWSQIKKDTRRFPTTPAGNESVNAALTAKATTSYVSPWETIQALNDGLDPAHSNDRTQSVYGNWPQIGTQWVQYDFDRAYTVSQTDVYWFKDGGGIDVPASYRVQYLDGTTWRNVPNAQGLGTKADAYNTTRFDPVSTTAVRLEIVAKNPASTGILEWKVTGIAR